MDITIIFLIILGVIILVLVAINVFLLGIFDKQIKK